MSLIKCEQTRQITTIGIKNKHKSLGRQRLFCQLFLQLLWFCWLYDRTSIIQINQEIKTIWHNSGACSNQSLHAPGTFWQEYIVYLIYKWNLNTSLHYILIGRSLIFACASPSFSCSIAGMHPPISEQKNMNINNSECVKNRFFNTVYTLKRMLCNAVHTCICMSHEVEHVYMCACAFWCWSEQSKMSGLGRQRLLRQPFFQLLWLVWTSIIQIHQDHLANPWSLLLYQPISWFLCPLLLEHPSIIVSNIFFLKRPLDTPNISQATSTTTHESQIVLDVLVTHIEIHTQYGPWFWPEILDLFPAASNHRNSLKRYSICDRSFEIVSVIPTSTSNLLLYCKYQETSRLSPLRLFRQPFLQLLCLCWLSIIQINQSRNTLRKTSLKNWVFNRNLFFQGSIFQGYFSFREGKTIWHIHGVCSSQSLQDSESFTKTTTSLVLLGQCCSSASLLKTVYTPRENDKKKRANLSKNFCFLQQYP